MKNMQMTYGYDDVTLVPTYSVLDSRSQSNISMKGFSLPIMASCMDTLGKDMMELFIENKIPFVAHRAFKSANEQVLHFFPNYTKNSNFLRNVSTLPLQGALVISFLSEPLIENNRTVLPDEFISSMLKNNYDSTCSRYEISNEDKPRIEVTYNNKLFVINGLLGYY